MDANIRKEQKDSSPATPNPRPRNIVLIGFMATGKTTIGRLLAERTQYTFVDTDSMVEEDAGMSIPKIFASEGEAGFRHRETTALLHLKNSRGCIISTGGGIITHAQNRKLLKQLGFIVWLHTKKTIILSRIRHNQNRPLMQTKNPEQLIHSLLEERKPLYKEVADIKIKTTYLSPNEITQGILDSACYFFSQQDNHLKELSIQSSPPNQAS